MIPVVLLENALLAGIREVPCASPRVRLNKR
jgi:hypothetical protein